VPQLNQLARAIVEADRLEGKLIRLPRRPSDDQPGEPLRLVAPGRPAELAIARAKDTRVPPVAGMRDPHQRARILHALANHELQAIELFAWALLAFPRAPAGFRRGLAIILGEEQQHLELYIERLAAHGHQFGDFPVTGHFWNHLDQLRCPRSFVCVMGLTFENANLDFAQEYARAAHAAGDTATAAVLEQVHRDELGHVRFAWRWLQRWRGDQPPWDAYQASVQPPLGPARARGRTLCQESRRAAGIEEGFIEQLAAVEPRRPGGAPR
jgi:uncharacterized ferritin-like protein (DUF455 family)